MAALHLTSTPDSSMPTACWSRSIDAGVYNWTWCLKPLDNAYLQSDELDPVRNFADRAALSAMATFFDQTGSGLARTRCRTVAAVTPAGIPRLLQWR